MGHRARILCSLVLATALAQCATAGSSSDPFSGAGSTGRDGVRTYNVHLEVVCSECLVTYSAGSVDGTEAVYGRWNERVRVTPRARTVVRLTASPVEGEVGRLRIEVDGEVVAEGGCRVCDPVTGRTGRGGTMTIETTLPR